jgi:hypothetical protein
MENKRMHRSAVGQDFRDLQAGDNFLLCVAHPV